MNMKKKVENGFELMNIQICFINLKGNLIRIQSQFNNKIFFNIKGENNKKKEKSEKWIFCFPHFILRQ